MTIDVVFSLGENSKPFVSLAVKLMQHLESGKHSIRYRGILGGTDDEHDIEVIAKVDRQPGPGDMTHAAVLDMMMKHVESDYTLISDADVAVLMQDWDDVCVKEVCDDVAAIGFKIPDERCKTFPCVRFCMFDSAKLIECQPEFTPVLNKGKRQHPVKGVPPLDEIQYLGTPIYQDTGWRMPVPFFKKGYRGLVMPYIPLKSSKCIIPPLDDAQRRRMKSRILGHEEYHWQNKLFATHKGQVRRGFSMDGLWESRVIAYAKEHFNLT